MAAGRAGRGARRPQLDDLWRRRAPYGRGARGGGHNWTTSGKGGRLMAAGRAGRGARRPQLEDLWQREARCGRVERTGCVDLGHASGAAATTGRPLAKEGALWPRGARGAGRGGHNWTTFGEGGRLMAAERAGLVCASAQLRESTLMVSLTAAPNPLDRSQPSDLCQRSSICGRRPDAAGRTHAEVREVVARSGSTREDRRRALRAWLRTCSEVREVVARSGNTCTGGTRKARPVSAIPPGSRIG